MAGKAAALAAGTQRDLHALSLVLTSMDDVGPRGQHGAKVKVAMELATKAKSSNDAVVQMLDSMAPESPRHKSSRRL